MNISLPHDNSTGSNKPHTKCQLTPLLARLTWSCLRQILEITENYQNNYKPWIGSPDDYLYTATCKCISLSHGLNLALLRFMSKFMKNVPTNPPLPYRPKETPQLIGLFSWNLVATNCMQCFLYGPIGCTTKFPTK